MEFSVFVCIVSALICFFSWVIIKLTILFNIKSLSYNTYLLGLMILIGVLLLYLPISNSLWQKWTHIIYPFLHQNPTHFEHLWKEIWHTFVFFRYIWPSLLLAFLMMNIEFGIKPNTGYFRNVMQFGHTKILVLSLALFIYLILAKLSYAPIIQNIMLNIVIYTATYYWQFGFLTILFLIKYFKIPYSIIALLLLAPMLIAGESFLLPIFMYIGIGISDIWMDYHKRDACTLLFSFNFD